MPIELPSSGRSQSGSKSALGSVSRISAVDGLSRYDSFDLIPDEAGWSPLRKTLASVFRNNKFEVLLACVLGVNMILVMVETDAEADRPAGEPIGTSPTWVTAFNHLLLSIYTAELTGRIYVYRAVFFTRLSSILDLVIVSSDLFFVILSLAMGNDLPSMSILRIFRLSRLGRAAKVMVMFPELHLMLKGLTGAMSAIFWGCILVAAVLFIWSILFVQLIHPLNLEVAALGTYEGCDRCPKAFESVPQAFLTFTQQVVAGDSWGQVSVPIIEEYPWTYVFFGGVLVSVSLTIMNLILAVIVDSAQEARKLSDHDICVEKAYVAIQAKDRLYKICEEIDTDKGGTLSLYELQKNWDTHDDFRDALKVMDIGKEDMTIVFNILDQDGNGEVEYEEFVTELHRMKTHDMHTMLIFIKFYVTEVHAKVTQQLTAIRGDMKSRVISNSLSVPLKGEASKKHHDTDRSHEKAVKHAPVEDHMDGMWIPPMDGIWEPPELQAKDVHQPHHLPDLSGAVDERYMPEMQRVHEELVTAMHDMVARLGSVLQRSQTEAAAQRRQEEILQKIEDVISLQAPFFGESPGRPVVPREAVEAYSAHHWQKPAGPPTAVPPSERQRSPLARKIGATGGAFVEASRPGRDAQTSTANDAIEVLLPPWPRESRPKLPKDCCCTLGGAGPPASVQQHTLTMR